MCVRTYVFFMSSQHTLVIVMGMKFFVRRRTLQSRSILFFVIWASHAQGLSIAHAAREHIPGCALVFVPPPRSFHLSTFFVSSLETRSVRREVRCIERKVKFLTFLFVDWLQQERNAWRASTALDWIEKDYTGQPTYGERERERKRILIRKKLSVISFSLFAWVCHRLIQCRRPHT